MVYLLSQGGCDVQTAWNNGPRRKPAAIIFPHELEKLPACQPIETASQFYSAVDFWETDHRAAYPARGRDKAFHNPAPGDAAIRGWPANHGLCSNPVIEALWPKLPATSPSSGGASSPARRSNSLGCPSRPATLSQWRQKPVFTQTQATQKFNTIALAFSQERFRNVPGMNRRQRRRSSVRKKLTLLLQNVHSPKFKQLI